MGRGGTRWGAGRPGWRAKAEQSLSLDVRVLARRRLLSHCFYTWRWRNTETGEEVGSIGITAQAGELVIRFRGGDQVVEQRVLLEKTECHFGGARSWFRCPQCHQRVALIYSLGGRFGCRSCRRIAYSSQSEDVVARDWRKQQKLERKLGDDWQRPKGMHRTTYERLIASLLRCEERRELAIGSLLKRLLGST